MLPRKLRKTTKKKLTKDIKIFLKKQKRKSNTVLVKATKISQKMKKKILLSMEKILQNEKKYFIIIIRKHFNLESLASL